MACFRWLRPQVCSCLGVADFLGIEFNSLHNMYFSCAKTILCLAMQVFPADCSLVCWSSLHFRCVLRPLQQGLPCKVKTQQCAILVLVRNFCQHKPTITPIFRWSNPFKPSLYRVPAINSPPSKSPKSPCSPGFPPSKSPKLSKTIEKNYHFHRVFRRISGRGHSMPPR